MYWPEEYDVIVIGAGHAGVEAALASVRVGAKAALFTMDLDAIGRMSCNPAIGGVAKGHLVREIDALGGEMGRAIDATGIQYRRLNTSKGPAVVASRAQADRAAYGRYMKHAVKKTPGLALQQEEIVGLLSEGGKVTGVIGCTGTMYRSKAVVLAAGTFMNGRIHVGMNSFPAGRAGEPPAKLLAENLKVLGFPIGRMKTGTPPRLSARSIDWDKLDAQQGDEGFTPFSMDNDTIERVQIPCHITYTNKRTHEIIQGSMDRSPLYSGVIEGIGPRYCPSIEDKVVRFPDRDRHQIFLEPEGYDDNEVYPNGISTSLPLDVQREIVRSMEGLENAEIVRPGYAVEYDYSDPTDLYPTLESKRMAGFYMAGQVNATSGYEEAAAQGLMAGVNAALSAKGQAGIVLGRHEGYIGVMIDDLTTKGASEPYRMFTSRAEHRLLLREDNAETRLSPLALKLGLLTEQRAEALAARAEDAKELHSFLAVTSLKPSAEATAVLERIGTAPLKQAVRLTEVLRRPEVTLDILSELVEGWPEVGPRTRELVQVEVKYEGYIKRDRESVAKMAKMENLAIPSDINYDEVDGLTAEVRQVLQKGLPMTLGQSQRLVGMNPAAAAVLLVHLRKIGAA
jgi:tRNA uridine 5-carboxymethylaminomethyl modification enzyme